MRVMGRANESSPAHRLSKLARATASIFGSMVVAAGAFAATSVTPSSAASSSCADPSVVTPALRVQLGASVAKSSTMPSTQYICPVGTPTGAGLLNITVTQTSGSAGDFFLCLRSIPDTKDLTATNYARTGHVGGATTQRVAVATPLAPEYEVKVKSTSSNTTSAIGCNGANGGPPLAFTMIASYINLPAATTAFSVQNLPSAKPSQSAPGSGEPSVVVDRLHGDRVYVSAPVGVPSGFGCAVNGQTDGCNGINFWYSTDGGNTFTFCNASDPNGGGDSTIALDSTGSIYSADLAGSNVDTQKFPSTASGAPTLKGGSNCGFSESGPTAAQSDREWLAAFLANPKSGTSATKVLLSFHTLSDNMPYECQGVNGGSAYLPACAPMITDPNVVSDASGNTVNGNQVFDSKGTVYSVFATSTSADNSADGGTGPIHNIYVAKSADGVNFTDFPIFMGQKQGTAGTKNSVNVANIFPVIAVDKADNLYVVWSQMSVDGGPSIVRYSSSTDHGLHWSAPMTVNPPTLHSNVLPWIAAGDDGRVDIVWVGSSTSDSNDVSSDWNVYMAQSLNAHDPSPVFAPTQVTPLPIRYGAICFQGINCTLNGDDGRILLDFISVDIDSKGMAVIAFANSGPDTGINPLTAVAHQTGGTSVLAAPSGAVLAQQAGTPFTAGPHTQVPLGGVVLMALGGLGLVYGITRRRWQRRGLS